MNCEKSLEELVNERMNRTGSDIAFAKLADAGTKAYKMAYISPDAVSVPGRRYEELVKKECLLHQIENAVNNVASYNLADALKLILSVLPV